MVEPIASWTEIVVVSALYAVVLTLVLSPLLLWLYRRRVTHWMQQPGSGLPDRDAESGQATALTWRVEHLDGAAAGEPPRVRSVEAGTWRLVAGYAVGGLACTLVLTACVGLAFADQWSTTVLLTALLVFLLPVLATVLFLLSARTGVRVASFAAAGLLLYLLLGYRQDLGLSLFNGFVLLPVLLLLVFSLRFWRGVAPMVMLLALPASVLAVAAVQLLAHGLGLGMTWPGRLAGFGLGALGGYAALRVLQRAHDRQRFSDLELFVDAWWLVYLLQQTVIFLLMRRSAFYAVALASFVPFVVLRRLTWRAWPERDDAGSPRDLLLLRVFADTTRTQTMVDRLEQRWRHIGNIRMIAGWDLALRNVTPADFVAFVGGRLRQQFVRDEQDLASRLASLPAGRDADGRFRVEHFWCHADSWRATMRALADRSAVVLMDLRGFNGDREGCRYELQHLARHAPEKPVVLLVDSERAYTELQQLLGGTEREGAAWTVVRAESGDAAWDRQLLACLERTQPVGAPHRAQKVPG